MSAANEHPVEGLSAFLDGEVTDRERGAIEAHLAACRSCRDLLEDLGRLDGAVADEEPPPMPAHLAARIRDAIASEAAAASVAAAPGPMAWRVTWRWGRGLPLAAAAGLLAAGFVWLIRLEPPRPVAPATSVIAPATFSSEPALRMNTPAPPSPPPASPTTKRSRAEAKKQTTEKETKDGPPGGAMKVAGQDKMSEGLRSLGYVGSIAATDATTVEALPYRVRLVEDRWMSVETTGYRCVVPVTREDAATLAAIVSSKAAPAAPPASSDVPAVSSAARVCAHLSPDDCRFVLDLIRERYRSALEQRCGPPPR